jgi:hypothetical protein
VEYIVPSPLGKRTEEQDLGHLSDCLLPPALLELIHNTLQDGAAIPFGD